MLALQDTDNVDAAAGSTRPYHRGDLVTAFDESSAAEGCLGRFSGSQVMPIIQQVLAS